jgi:hypothetical protein
MSDEQGEQLDNSDFGRPGLEKAAGYTPLQHAVPDERKEPALTDEQLAHWNRPQQPPPVERSYNDVNTGEPTPDNQTVELERASRDISEIRAAERAALEQQRNADLQDALGWLEREQQALADATTPRPVEQQAQEPQPDGLQPEQTPYEQATAQIDEADKAIQELLKDPLARSHIEAEFNQVRAEVDTAKAQYREATEQLALQAQSVITALYPELAGLNAQQMQGALQVMARNQPERVQQLAQLNGRAQNLISVYQQQQAEQRQLFQQQVAKQQQLYAQQLQQYEAAEVKRYEAAIARDRTPEQIKALRENVMPMVEKHYGIPKARMQALYSGQEYADAATFMRSANFQMMLSDALSYRMSKEAVGRAVARPVPNVQRPGSAGEAQTRTQAALAEAEAKLKPSMNPREAANYLIARRAAR